MEEFVQGVDFVGGGGGGYARSVTSHGRVVGAYLSAQELANYEALKRRASEVLRVGEPDEETVAAIGAAEYGVEPR